MIKYIAKTNHDGVRATAMMLRSNVASLEITSEASLRNYIDRPLNEQPWACSDVLSDALSDEGHISHCNRVLRLCHPEKSSCSGEFSCRSFAKIALSSLSTICHVKNLRVFVSHNSARFPLNISPPHFVTGTKKLQAKVLDSTCQITKFVNNCRRMWNLMVWHFWQH